MHISSKRVRLAGLGLGPSAELVFACALYGALCCWTCGGTESTSNAQGNVGSDASAGSGGAAGTVGGAGSGGTVGNAGSMVGAAGCGAGTAKCCGDSDCPLLGETKDLCKKYECNSGNCEDYGSQCPSLGCLVRACSSPEGQPVCTLQSSQGTCSPGWCCNQVGSDHYECGGCPPPPTDPDGGVAACLNTDPCECTIDSWVNGACVHTPAPSICNAGMPGASMVCRPDLGTGDGRCCFYQGPACPPLCGATVWVGSDNVCHYTMPPTWSDNNECTDDYCVCDDSTCSKSHIVHAPNDAYCLGHPACDGKYHCDGSAGSGCVKGPGACDSLPGTTCKSPCGDCFYPVSAGNSCPGGGHPLDGVCVTCLSQGECPPGQTCDACGGCRAF